MGYRLWGHRESDMTKQLSVCTHTDNLTLKITILRVLFVI